MKILADYTYDQLIDLMQSLGYPKFRGEQVYKAIIQSKDYYDLTNVPKDMRASLSQDYILKPVKIKEVVKSNIDGTKKYLISLHDGHVVESVFLKQNYGNTICLSTQVGCRMGCKFCASTLDGLVRNLSNGEMLSIIALINADNGKPTDRNFTNIVLMGSGEPLDNFDNVVAFLRAVNDPHGFNIAMRNISVSTCGLVEKINDLAKLNLDITLCISLHAPNDEIRRTIMPIANKYTIAQIVTALKNYIKTTGRRAVLEYTLIEGVNDSDSAVRELANTFKNMLVHFNVICINPYDSKFVRPAQKKAYAFVDKLNKAGLSATLRASHGTDIQSACGQLRNQRKKEGQQV